MNTLSDTFVQASEPDQLYFKNTAALSPDGHALYAHELAEFLRRQLPSASPAGRDYAPLSPQARLPQR